MDRERDLRWLIGAVHSGIVEGRLKVGSDDGDNRDTVPNLSELEEISQDPVGLFDVGVKFRRAVLELSEGLSDSDVEFLNLLVRKIVRADPDGIYLVPHMQAGDRIRTFLGVSQDVYVTALGTSGGWGSSGDRLLVCTTRWSLLSVPYGGLYMMPRRGTSDGLRDMDNYLVVGSRINALLLS